MEVNFHVNSCALCITINEKKTVDTQTDDPHSEITWQL